MDELEKIIEHLELENAKRATSDPLTRASLDTVYKFIQTHPVMCYGGTAINNLLPKEDRFYDPEVDIPDYDFFSKTPQEHAMFLANTLSEIGVKNVEVRPGIHLGTFKVFADFEGVADITHLDSKIFDKLWEESVERDGVHYVPPNLLRMSMYLELSRPRGDVSRWKKVFSRLQLLNKHHPIECPISETEHRKLASKSEIEDVMKLLHTEPVVLLGVSAAESHLQKHWTLPITLLATKETIDKLSKDKKVEVDKGTDILPARYSIIDDDGLARVRFYETAACHSYHQTRDGVRIASIPTILQFLFAFVYSSKKQKNISNMLCIAQRLVEMANNKPKRRFALLTPIDCIGQQDTLIDMRKNKAALYEKYSKNKQSPEFLKYFFTYNPRASKTERQKARNALRKTRKARFESSY
jgi:hypothetical protein